MFLKIGLRKQWRFEYFYKCVPHFNRQQNLEPLPIITDNKIEWFFPSARGPECYPVRMALFIATHLGPIINPPVLYFNFHCEEWRISSLTFTDLPLYEGVGALPNIDLRSFLISGREFKFFDQVLSFHLIVRPRASNKEAWREDVQLGLG